MSGNNEFTKSFIRTLVLAALVLAGLFINVAAQDDFTAETLANLEKNASEKLEGKTYRSVTTTTTTEYNTPEVTKTTFETVPPDRRRYISERKTADGISILETVYIGKKVYEKKDDGEWKDITGMGSGGG